MAASISQPESGRFPIEVLNTTGKSISKVVCESVRWMGRTLYIYMVSLFDFSIIDRNIWIN